MTLSPSRPIVYGRTTQEGVYLLKPDDLYPRLTEEEERWHGALLGNTTHGLIYQVLKSFNSNNREIYLINLDLIKKPFPEYDDNSLNKTTIEFHFLANMLFDKACLLHEALSKFMAHIEGNKIYGDDQSLISIYISDSSRYNYMQFLEKLVGPPYLNTNFDPYFRDMFYMLAKYIFFTDTLSKLHLADAIDLQNLDFVTEVIENDTLLYRAKTLQDSLSLKEISEYYINKYSEIEGNWVVFQDEFFKFLDCHTGMQTVPYTDGFELYKQALSVSIRLCYLYPGNTSILPIGGYGGGMSYKIDHSLKFCDCEVIFGHWNTWQHDPAYSVFTEPCISATEHQYKQSLQEFQHYIVTNKPQHIFMFVTPDKAQDSIKVLAITMDHLFSKGEIDEHKLVIAFSIKCAPSELRTASLVQSPPKGLSIVFFDITYDFATKKHLRSIFHSSINMIFIDLWCDLNRLMSFQELLLLNVPEMPYDSRLGNIRRTSESLALFAVQETPEGHFSSVGNAPLYFEELMRKIFTSLNPKLTSGRTSPRVINVGTGKSEIISNVDVEELYILYNCIFRYEYIPEYFFEIKKEDIQWILTKL